MCGPDGKTFVLSAAEGKKAYRSWKGLGVVCFIPTPTISQPLPLLHALSSRGRVVNDLFKHREGLQNIRVRPPPLLPLMSCFVLSDRHTRRRSCTPENGGFNPC